MIRESSFYQLLCITCSCPLARQLQLQPSRRPSGCCPQKVGILHRINIVFFSSICKSFYRFIIAICTICVKLLEYVFFCFSPNVDEVWTRQLLQSYGSIRIAVSSLWNVKYYVVAAIFSPTTYLEIILNILFVFILLNSHLTLIWTPSHNSTHHFFVQCHMSPILTKWFNE